MNLTITSPGIPTIQLLVPNVGLAPGLTNAADVAITGGSISGVTIDVSEASVTATGGTVERTLPAWFSDLQNAIGGGAVGDGTTDNLAAFEGTYAAAKTRSNTVFVPGGSYNLSGSPVVSGTASYMLTLGGASFVNGNAGMPGMADGSAFLYPDASGFGMFGVLGLNRNQFVLSVQAQNPASTGTTSTEKAGIYIAVTQHEVSNAGVSGGWTKDLVGLQSSATVSSGNTQGRIWGACFGAYMSAGAQGAMDGIEIDVTNNSGVDSNLPESSDPYYKNGAIVVSGGTNMVGSAFSYASSHTTGKVRVGYWGDQAFTNDYFLLYTDASFNPIAYVDVDGNISTTGQVSGDSLYANSGEIGSLLFPAAPQTQTIAFGPIIAFSGVADAGYQIYSDGVVEGGTLEVSTATNTIILQPTAALTEFTITLADNDTPIPAQPGTRLSITSTFPIATLNIISAGGGTVTPSSVTVIAEAAVALFYEYSTYPAQYTWVVIDDPAAVARSAISSSTPNQLLVSTATPGVSGALVVGAGLNIAGSALVVEYGTSAGTAAQGNDARFASAEQTANKGLPNGYAGLDGSGKVPIAQIPAAVVGALNYQGTWNAATNTPTLTSGTGTKGYYYKVSAAGTTTVDGTSTWGVQDLIAFDGTTWDKIDGISSEVTTVAGRTGAVTLVASDISGLAAAASAAAPVQSVVGQTGNVTTAQISNALGLGGAALLAVGTVAGTVAAGNDSRITGALQSTTAASTYAPLASPALTGAPTAPTATAGNSSTLIATTAFVGTSVATETSRATAAEALKAPLASPSLTGSPTINGNTPETQNNKGVASGYASLDGTGKVPIAQIPAAVVGALNYQGTWNASTNSPPLTSGTGTKGYYYKVATAGTTTVDGNSTWNVQDLIAFDGTTWDKIDGISSEVTSVAGRTGAVTLGTSDISGFTAAAAAAAPVQSVVGQTGAVTAAQIATALALSSTYATQAALAALTYLPPRTGTVTYASTLAVSWASEDVQTVTLTGNTTITNSGAVDGQRMTLYVVQGGAGSFTVSFAAGTAFNTTIPSITLSTAAGAVDMIGLVYRAATGKYNVIAFAQGVS